MPGPKPPAVPLSETERHALHTLIRAHKTPQHLSFRAHVILLWGAALPHPTWPGASAPHVPRSGAGGAIGSNAPAVPRPSVSKTPHAPGLLLPSAPRSG